MIGIGVVSALASGGLLRTREFIMKDAYSLHLDSAGMEEAYEAQAAASVMRRWAIAPTGPTPWPPPPTPWSSSRWTTPGSSR